VWFDWQARPEIDFSDLAAICPEGQYRVVTPDVIPPGLISPALLAKTHSVLIMCSGTASGRVYAMLNLNRIDRSEVDQMPYAIAFDAHEPIPSGVLIQHAGYPGRTSPLPADFYEYIAASGTYPLKGMPPADSGPISELRVGSQEEAFSLLVTVLEKEFPEDEP